MSSPSNPVDLVIVILNTTQIERQLSVALQLKQLLWGEFFLGQQMAQEGLARSAAKGVDQLAEHRAEGRFAPGFCSVKIGLPYAPPHQAVCTL